jgi:uncharacterized protein
MSETSPFLMTSSTFASTSTSTAAGTPGRLLAITGGHRVDLDEFTAMLDAVCTSIDWTWQHATQPSAQQWLRPEHAGTWDAILLHDLPGLHLARGQVPTPEGPTNEVRAAVRDLLVGGQGLVVTHHALAGWPAWQGWATAIGGRYLYAPGLVRGRVLPSSGYRMDVHHVEVLAPGHPVCDGVEQFDVDDELYLCPIFEDEVVPLLATTAAMDGERFVSTYEAVVGGDHVTAADHPVGSRLVGWAKSAERSPLVYLQPGHGPETMCHPQYRRLLANAVRWVASPAAHAWSGANPAPITLD